MKEQGIEITYAEYTTEMILPRHVGDINQLIPQLSQTAGPLDEAWLREVLASPTRVFVALAGDRIVGTVLLVPTKIWVGWKDWIDDVVVDKDFQGQGISSRLMDLAEAASAASPAKHVNLTSKPHRTRAQAVYRKRGYIQHVTDVFRLTHNRPS